MTGREGVEYKTGHGTVRITAPLGRRGETLLYRAQWDGREVVARVFAPRGFLRRKNDTLAAVAGLPPQVREALGRFVLLGETLRDNPSPAYVPVHQVVSCAGQFAWLTDALPKDGAPLALINGSPTEVIAFGQALARALEDLHRVTLHLDLSPRSVRWRQGRVLLDCPRIDRRLLMAPRADQAGLVNRDYDALELHDGTGRLPLSGATDLYAANALLYQLATGRRPKPLEARLADPDWWRAQELGHWPTRLGDVLERGLRLAATDRWPTAAAWREALDGISIDLDARARADGQVAAATAAAKMAPAAEAAALAPIPVEVKIPTNTADTSPATRQAGPRRSGIGALLGGVAALGVAGGVVWAVNPSGEVYYAAREVNVRREADASSAVVTQWERGHRFHGEPAGARDGIPWVKITGGWRRGAYISQRNVVAQEPPSLTLTFTTPLRTETLQAGEVYATPGASVAISAFKAGEVFLRVGELGDDWVEVLGTKGGVAYVRGEVFRSPAPPAIMAVDSAAEPAARAGPPVAEPVLPAPPKPDAPTAPPPPAKRPSTAAPSAPLAPAQTPTTRAPVQERRPAVAPPPAPPPPPPPPSAPAYIAGNAANWRSTPSARQKVEATPGYLMADETRAQIVVDCRIAVSGRLEDCRLQSQTSGHELVEPIKMLLPLYVMADVDKQGYPTANRRYRLSVTFGVF